MTSMSDVYMLRKLAIVVTVDFLIKAWAERNICTWVLGFEISSRCPESSFPTASLVSKQREPSSLSRL